MEKREFAIVDIETTGGNASGSRITEIAILIHDGEQVIDRWETLVNPGRDIPPAIFALTGITNEMVADAPYFPDIAQRVFEMLSGRIFVAHSVNFDYSFVRHELEAAGFQWTAKKLCTIRASRKIRTGLRSYSLGNLCRELGIPLVNRHRAGGDADATAILFGHLLRWDTEGHLNKMLSRGSQDYRLPPNLPQSDFDSLPEKPGVYYFYNQFSKVIYVGKAVNIRKRVASHFTGHNINPQRQHFLREIHAISSEICPTELFALILECSEIQRLWPAYNRALKRFEPKFGLLGYEARNGHRYLAVGKLQKHQSCLQPYNTLFEAVNALSRLAAEFDLDRRFCNFGTANGGDFIPVANQNSMPDAEQHNDRVEMALESLRENGPTFAIVDKGRTPHERSCIYIEDGIFHSMGYLSADEPIQNLSQLPDFLSRYKSNQYIMQLVQAFADKNPQKVFTRPVDAMAFAD